MRREGKLNVCLAGVTGWAGSALGQGVVDSDDLILVSGVSRSHAGQSLAAVLELPPDKCGGDSPVVATVAEALSGAAAIVPDVLVEYTQPDFALGHIRQALSVGVHVVIGTSGLVEDDFKAIDAMAQDLDLGVLACGNFSITAELMQQFSVLAARWVPAWEIIDYAGAAKPDAPSGTGRELAARMAAVASPEHGVAPDDVKGPAGVRGGNVSGTQVHSVRLPGFILSVESVFGLPGERLSIRHDAGESAQPYVGGALLAIRQVGNLRGLHRGLRAVMGDAG